MDMDSARVDQSFMVPDTFKRIISCAEELQYAWTLSRSFNGIFSLKTSEPQFPAKTRRRGTKQVSKSVTRKSQEVISDVTNPKSPESPKEKKTPSQMRRDRERRKAWKLRWKQRRARTKAAPAQTEFTAIGECPQFETDITSISKEPELEVTTVPIAPGHG